MELTMADKWAIAFGVAVVIGVIGCAYAIAYAESALRLHNESNGHRIRANDAQNHARKLELDNVKMKETISIIKAALSDYDKEDES